MSKNTRNPQAEKQTKLARQQVVQGSGLPKWNGIISVVSPIAIFSANSHAAALGARLTDETGKPYMVETFEAFEDRKNRHYLDGFKLAEISEDFYYQMLNVLPPMYRGGAMGFFMCEFTSGTITSQFVEYRGKFYGAAVDVLNRETWITPDKIDSLQVGEPLAWFPKGE